MAKISDFGNTWAKFFCRGETHAVHLARHPSPLHGKNRANWHRLQKIFSARESSSNVQNRAFWKPFRKFFSNCFARVSTAIDHPCESCQHHLLSAAPYCPLPFYVKIEAKLKPFFEIFLIRSIHHRLQRVLSSYRQLSFHLPLHIYMAKISDFGNTWAKFFASVKLVLKICPTFFGSSLLFASKNSAIILENVQKQKNALWHSHQRAK